ncbi:MAG: cadmium-translocating P-type ATPase [Oscillospiraceae bacterium]|nr:cadmium-translocating P-type ATPase [Oscillospiraceae bacterium]
MSKQKKVIIRLVIGGIFFILALTLPVDGILKLALFLLPYFIIGGDVLRKALRNITNGQVFDENFLMAIATVGAFFVGEYPEGVAVMLFYQLGELFQSYAVNHSRKSIASLMDIRPDTANLVVGDKIEEVDPDDVSIGEMLLVRPGERVPIDGIVVEGCSTLDTSALTGESVPREVAEGSEVLSGCINGSGVLKIRTTKEFGESTVAKILDLVENASSKKAQYENFITKFARYYTPAVVITALLLAVIPPMLLEGALWSDWIYRALIFLVVSCPCALVISIPLGFFGGIGGASRQGVLIKGGNYMEALANAQTVVFDKTGTLTKGVFRVAQICPKDVSEEYLLEMAACAEAHSSHPISQSLKTAYGKEIAAPRIGVVREIAGHGVRTVVDGVDVAAGNDKLMTTLGIDADQPEAAGTVVHIALDGVYAGYIVIADEIKENSKAALEKLRQIGVQKTVMLTGDSKTVGEAVAAQLGIDEVYTQLLPADKVDKVEKLLNAKVQNSTLVFVGDGINDAPVLTRSDIGIAMGALGSDAAIEAADVVLMNDDPMGVAKAVEISRKTIRIVKQNIVFALLIKGGVLVLGAFGMANMWEAVFADVGVSVIAILNSIRTLNSK